MNADSQLKLGHQHRANKLPTQRLTPESQEQRPPERRIDPAGGGLHKVLPDKSGVRVAMSGCIQQPQALIKY